MKIVKLQALDCTCPQMCSYSSMDGVLYCKPHFEQLFKETGSFSKKFQTRKRTFNLKHYPRLNFTN